MKAMGMNEAQMLKTKGIFSSVQKSRQLSNKKDSWKLVIQTWLSREDVAAAGLFVNEVLLVLG
jgi:hypothetical protein